MTNEHLMFASAHDESCLVLMTPLQSGCEVTVAGRCTVNYVSYQVNIMSNCSVEYSPFLFNRRSSFFAFSFKTNKQRLYLQNKTTTLRKARLESFFRMQIIIIQLFRSVGNRSKGQPEINGNGKLVFLASRSISQ